MYAFFRHIWAEISFLFWTFLSGTFFFRWGGGARAPSALPLLRTHLYIYTLHLSWRFLQGRNVRNKRLDRPGAILDAKAKRKTGERKKEGEGEK